MTTMPMSGVIELSDTVWLIYRKHHGDYWLRVADPVTGWVRIIQRCHYPWSLIHQAKLKGWMR